MFNITMLLDSITEGAEQDTERIKRRMALTVLPEGEKSPVVCDEIHEFRRRYGYLPSIKGLPCNNCPRNE